MSQNTRVFRRQLNNPTNQVIRCHIDNLITHGNVDQATTGWSTSIKTPAFLHRVQKTGFLLKSPTQWVFWVLLGFWTSRKKTGKIIQKLSNLKP